VADDTDITLWMNKHRLKALQEHDIDVENRLYDFFNSLYMRYVPPGEREMVEARISADDAESERQYEQSRRFALLTIVQDGASACYEYDKCDSILTAAQWFVTALKANTKPPSDNGIRTILPEMTESVQQMQTDSRVTLCAELNHDKGYMRVWEDSEWVEYGGDALTKAVRAATRKQHLKPHQREDIYKEKLEELTAATPDFNADEDFDTGMQMQ
jgi:hypothetical protein